MFVNIFPKTLRSLMLQTYPRHLFQMVMYPLISPDEYASRALSVDQGRHLLTEEELSTARSFKIAKRQNEWLTGRICAKAATLMQHNTISPLIELDLAKIYIENTQSGRPRLRGELTPDLQKADISISHGAGYGIGFISDTRCGIDLQAPQDTLIRVRDKFCTAEEQELLQIHLPELKEIQHLTLIWTAKEAAKKTLSHRRMPGFLELILTTIEPHTSGWIINFLVSSREYEKYPATISVVSELYENFSIALCICEEDINA